MDTVTFANGVTYRTHDALSSSDGSIGVANIRVLLAEFEGRVDAWSQLELHDEARGITTQRVQTARVSGGQDWVFAHRVPTKECLLVTDALGSETIYLRCGSSHEGVIDALNDYPSIDDVVVSEVEAEWEKEAWQQWIKDALFHTMKDTPLRDWAETFLDDEVLYESYRSALDGTGVYPEIERHDVVLDVKHIVVMFEQILRLQAAREYDRSEMLDETGGC